MQGMSKKTCLPTCKPITATEESHCTSCHNSFYTVASFDLHRYDPEVPEDQDNTCWQPESIGLILEKNMWATPEEHEKRRMFESRLEAARAARGKNGPDSF